MSSPTRKQIQNDQEIEDRVSQNQNGARLREEATGAPVEDAAPTAAASSLAPPPSTTAAYDPTFLRDLSELRGCLREIAASLSTLEVPETPAEESTMATAPLASEPTPATAPLPTSPAPPTETSPRPKLVTKWNLWIQCDTSKPSGGFCCWYLNRVYRMAPASEPTASSAPSDVTGVASGVVRPPATNNSFPFEYEETKTSNRKQSEDKINDSEAATPIALAAESMAQRSNDSETSAQKSQKNDFKVGKPQLTESSDFRRSEALRLAPLINGFETGNGQPKTETFISGHDTLTPPEISAPLLTNQIIEHNVAEDNVPVDNVVEIESVNSEDNDRADENDKDEDDRPLEFDQPVVGESTIEQLKHEQQQQTSELMFHTSKNDDILNETMITTTTTTTITTTDIERSIESDRLSRGVVSQGDLSEIVVENSPHDLTAFSAFTALTKSPPASAASSPLADASPRPLKDDEFSSENKIDFSVNEVVFSVEVEIDLTAPTRGESDVDSRSETATAHKEQFEQPRAFVGDEGPDPSEESGQIESNREHEASTHQPSDIDFTPEPCVHTSTPQHLVHEASSQSLVDASTFGSGGVGFGVEVDVESDAEFDFEVEELSREELESLAEKIPGLKVHPPVAIVVDAPDLPSKDDETIFEPCTFKTDATAADAAAAENDRRGSFGVYEPVACLAAEGYDGYETLDQRRSRSRSRQRSTHSDIYENVAVESEAKSGEGAAVKQSLEKDDDEDDDDDDKKIYDEVPIENEENDLESLEIGNRDENKQPAIAAPISESEQSPAPPLHPPPVYSEPSKRKPAKYRRRNTSASYDLLPTPSPDLSRRDLPCEELPLDNLQPRPALSAEKMESVAGSKGKREGDHLTPPLRREALESDIDVSVEAEAAVALSEAAEASEVASRASSDGSSEGWTKVVLQTSEVASRSSSDACSEDWTKIVFESLETERAETGEEQNGLTKTADSVTDDLEERRTSQLEDVVPDKIVAPAPTSERQVEDANPYEPVSPDVESDIEPESKSIPAPNRKTIESETLDGNNEVVVVEKQRESFPTEVDNENIERENEEETIVKSVKEGEECTGCTGSSDQLEVEKTLAQTNDEQVMASPHNLITDEVDENVEVKIENETVDLQELSMKVNEAKIAKPLEEEDVKQITEKLEKSDQAIPGNFVKVVKKVKFQEPDLIEDVNDAETVNIKKQAVTMDLDYVGNVSINVEEAKVEKTLVSAESEKSELTSADLPRPHEDFRSETADDSQVKECYNIGTRSAGMENELKTASEAPIDSVKEKTLESSGTEPFKEKCTLGTKEEELPSEKHEEEHCLDLNVDGLRRESINDGERTSDEMTRNEMEDRTERELREVSSEKVNESIGATEVKLDEGESDSLTEIEEIVDRVELVLASEKQLVSSSKKKMVMPTKMEPVSAPENFVSTPKIECMSVATEEFISLPEEERIDATEVKVMFQKPENESVLEIKEELVKTTNETDSENEINSAALKETSLTAEDESMLSPEEKTISEPKIESDVALKNEQTTMTEGQSITTPEENSISVREGELNSVQQEDSIFPPRKESLSAPEKQLIFIPEEDSISAIEMKPIEDPDEEATSSPELTSTPREESIVIAEKEPVVTMPNGQSISALRGESISVLSEESIRGPETAPVGDKKEENLKDISVSVEAAKDSVTLSAKTEINDFVEEEKQKLTSLTFATAEAVMPIETRQGDVGTSDRDNADETIESVESTETETSVEGRRDGEIDDSVEKTEILLVDDSTTDAEKSLPMEQTSAQQKLPLKLPNKESQLKQEQLQQTLQQQEEEKEEKSSTETRSNELSVDAEATLLMEPVVPLLRTRPSEIGKNRGESHSRASSEEEEEARALESNLEKLATEADEVLERKTVAVMVEGLKGAAERGEKRNGGDDSAKGHDEADRDFNGGGEGGGEGGGTSGEGGGEDGGGGEGNGKSDGNYDDNGNENGNGLAATLDKLQLETAEVDQVLELIDDMDKWRPPGIARRRGEELPTPYLAKKRRRPESEILEVEDHERRLMELDFRIDEILAPMAQDEWAEEMDAEELFRVGAVAPLAVGEGIYFPRRAGRRRWPFSRWPFSWMSRMFSFRLPSLTSILRWNWNSVNG